MSIPEILVFALTVVVLIPMAVLAAESIAAVWPKRRRGGADPGRRPAASLLPFALSDGRVCERPRCAVLVPAHDEEAGVAATVAGLRAQLRADDLLLVVADNCTDHTAECAVAAGATVIERRDPERRGKAFALQFGLAHLDRHPPDVVVIADADCRISPGGIDALVRQAAVTGRPAQALYSVQPPPGADIRVRLSAFAVFYKNIVRPTGLSRLGLPCLLTGTGMAFPWPVVQHFGPARADLVEDMSLSVDLAIAGAPADICPGATVTAEQPGEGKTALTQRTRWEHGHMQTLVRCVPRLTARAVTGLRPTLLALALELAVPPLALLAMMWCVASAAAAGLWATGGTPVPAWLLAGAGAVVAGSMAAAWFRFAREQLPLSSLLAAPFYVAWKVPIYMALLVRPQRKWIRTDRGASQPARH